MNRIVILVLVLLSFVGVSMAASWTGWISDAKCGTKGANASHAGCAKTCIKAGEKPVLVTDSGQLFKIANPESVRQYAGERVIVTGHENAGTVSVQQVKLIQKPGSK
jgi:hypothetical protein